MTTPNPPATLYCTNHPDRETVLRCNQCEEPMCIKCMVLTPTGYRCKSCVRARQRVFDTALPQDYVFGIGVAGILGLIGGLFASFLGFFTILIAPVAGTIIAEAVRMVIRKRRSKRLFLFIAGAVAVGSALPILTAILGSVLSFIGSGILFRGISFSILWQAVFAFLATSTTYYRLSGMNFRR